MKRIALAATAVLLLVSACGPSFEREEELVQEVDEKKETAIIPKFKLSTDYYQTILPFVPAETRGLINMNVQNRMDVEVLETGLLRIAQESFNTNDYFFKEGHFLQEDDVKEWLNRKEEPQAEPEVPAQDDQTETENDPLAPENPSEQENPDTPEQQNTNEAEAENDSLLQVPQTISTEPQYLSYLLEHTYYQKNDNDEIELGGIVIGLSLNPDLPPTPQAEPPTGRNAPSETATTPEEILIAEGRKLAQKAVNTLRKKEEVGQDVPIVVALFKEQPKDAVAPGHFISKAIVKYGENRIGDWTPINERYVFFPSSEAAAVAQSDEALFTEFEKSAQAYFSNHIGITGRGYYKDNTLENLVITITLEYNSKSEVIGFTQFITEQVVNQFPEELEVKVYIASLDRQESLIVRSANKKKPFVHIYQ